MKQTRIHISTRYIIVCVFLIVASIFAMFGVATQLKKAHAAAPIKIMPLGDSITGSPGCWRALLWNNLQSGGYTNINFVGTLNNSSACGVAFDGDNEGHGGYLATNIANQNLLPSWLSYDNPDIVLMHLGTNDVWNNIAPTTILSAYSKLVGQMRANNSHVRILVAQITPMNPSGCAYCAQGVINLNAAIPGWASSLSTSQSPIVVVDQWTGYNDSTDTIDGVHPNASGNPKIAAKWYAPLTAQIQAINNSGNGGGGGSGFTPTAGAHYRIVNRNSGQDLEITGWSTANGGLVDQWTNSNGANQEWSFVGTNGGYKLINVNSGLLLDNPGGSTSTGTQLDQWSDTNGSNQWWNIVSDNNGYYSLVNQKSGLSADVSGASTTNGAAVIQWTGGGGNNQQWSFVQVGGSSPTPPPGFTPTAGAHYRIVNRNSGQDLDIAGWSTANGGLVDQWPNSNGANQEWSFVASNGGYKLINVNSGLLLDNPGGSTSTGTQLDQWSDTNGSNQWWNIVSENNGYYSLVNQKSGLSIDVSGSSTTNGAAVIQGTGTGSISLQWSFVQV